jgi:hypothetical protein
MRSYRPSVAVLRTRNPQPTTRNPQPGTRNPEPATRNPQPATRNPEPATRNPKSATRNPELGTRNPHWVGGTFNFQLGALPGESYPSVSIDTGSRCQISFEYSRIVRSDEK